MGDGRRTTRLKGLGVTLVLAVLLACGLGLAGCSGSTSSAGDAAEDLGLVTPGKLSVVSDLANPPFDYIEEGTTNPAGFEVELMQALAQKLGLECEFLPAQKFDSIIPMIKQGGKADVGASNFTITDERLEEIDFTDAYIDSNQGVVTSAALAGPVEADYSSALDQAGATVAVQAGTTGEAWARENLPNANVVALDDPIAALTGVQSGRYQAVVADLPVMQYEVLNSYTQLKVALQVPTGEQYGIVVSKDNPRLTAALDEALAEARADGTLDALEQKWFGSSEGSSATAATTQGDATAGSSSANAADAGSVAVEKATARPNENGGSGVIGGMNTRLTWEGTVHVAAGVSSVTLTLPEGSTFDGSSTRVTVLDGLDRVSVDATAKPSGTSLEVDFATPIPDGSLLRLEVTDMQFPAAGGDYSVGGSYATAGGATGSLADSPSISIIKNTPVQAVVNWLDGQAWVGAWNSVPFLNMFFKPQLLVTSFVSLFQGWLVCLALVVVAYPFAILLGLAFALMKISKHRVLRAIAIVYINILRGTPLFLQIYIMFFGLPMLGINIDNNVLGVIVIAINSSAYQAEIFRAGIQSIPQGQYEASASLGMTDMQTMLWIILPQTVRRVIPTITSDFITSYKDTSLLSSVGVMELMMFSKNLTTVSGNITPYIAAAVYYLIVTLPLTKAVGVVERRLYDAEHGAGPRPKEPGEATGEKASEAPAGGAPEPRASMVESLAAPFRSHVRTDGGVADAL
ncbi:ABC transporter permease subunit [uncultured Olsenella sp.]|uniref:ABC transporter permease subunit n=1 Tax=uncultured Olsenella sp. TaxID=190764 RepID=UPI0026DC1EE0|nr:ABC transporter permease subunit [uncultured Olsenella sp.]